MMHGPKIKNDNGDNTNFHQSMDGTVHILDKYGIENSLGHISNFLL